MPQTVTPDDRVPALLDVWTQRDVDLAAMLCDRHPADAIAILIIQSDLSSVDLTYGELTQRSRRVAVALALASMGVRPGHRVATLIGKSEEYVVTVLGLWRAGAVPGLWRAGAVPVPIFTAFAASAIAVRLEGSGTTVAICDAEQRSKLDPSKDVPTDPAWQVVTAGELPGINGVDPAKAPQMARTGDTDFVRLFTSGTTGTSGTSGTTGTHKRVPIPIFAGASFQTYLEYGLNVTEDDVFRNAADLGWAHGLIYGIIAPLASGRRSQLLQAGFSPHLTWRVLSSYGVTTMAAAPTAFRSLRSTALHIPEDLKLRALTSAGEPLNPAMVSWGRDTLGVEIHDKIHDTYGQTEIGICGINSWHPDAMAPVREGSMGRPQPEWAMTVLENILDEPASPGEAGRVTIDPRNSPAMWFTGYVDAPEKTAKRFTADGRWYNTGDAGTTDENGYLLFAARDDDVIILARYPIGPFEVESVLLTDPAVAEAAVVGVPDELRGEVVEAFVVLTPGAEASDELAKSLQQRVKDKLAAHVYPRTVHFVEELPKTPSGKVQRFVLRNQTRA